ncbi:glutamate decarboxylase beta, partial [Escherichia coli 3.4870]
RRPGYRLGLPPAACEIDQCFRPQIRSGSAGLRLGYLA